MAYLVDGMFARGDGTFRAGQLELTPLDEKFIGGFEEEELHYKTDEVCLRFSLLPWSHYYF